EDEVEGEPVGRPRRDPEPFGQLRLSQLVHAAPNGIAAIAEGIRVVQQQAIEAVHAAARQRFLRGGAEILGKLIRRTQLRVSEAWKALRAIALAGVEVVPDGADEAIGIARPPRERTPEHLIRGAAAINVCRHERADAALVGLADHADESVLGERLTEVHETS